MGRTNAKKNRRRRRHGAAMTVRDSEIPFRSVLVFPCFLACFPMLVVTLRKDAFACNEKILMT